MNSDLPGAPDWDKIGAQLHRVRRELTDEPEMLAYMRDMVLADGSCRERLSFEGKSTAEQVEVIVKWIVANALGGDGDGNDVPYGCVVAQLP